MDSKKLSLKKELLAELSSDELRVVVAADGTDTAHCWLKTFTQFSVCSLC